jgi:hypothetical protein
VALQELWDVVGPHLDEISQLLSGGAGPDEDELLLLDSLAQAALDARTELDRRADESR